MLDEKRIQIIKNNTERLIREGSIIKEKRGRFTYEMGEIAMQNKAKTSLERAKKFNEEIRKLLEVEKW